MLGQRLLTLIHTLLLMLEFKNSTATKLEDASLMMPKILTEVILPELTVMSILATLLFLFLFTLLTEPGLFNGLGSEELLPWEITTPALITRFQVDHLYPPKRMLFSMEETTHTQDKTNASSSTLTDFTDVLTNHATTQFTL